MFIMGYPFNIVEFLFVKNTLNKMLLRDDTKKGLKYSHAIEVQSIPFDIKKSLLPLVNVKPS